jgi:hypothetical protein
MLDELADLGGIGGVADQVPAAENLLDTASLDGGPKRLRLAESASGITDRAQNPPSKGLGNVLRRIFPAAAASTFVAGIVIGRSIRRSRCGGLE